LLRVIGSPDPYGKQIDGMGGATSSTSKTVILSKSTKPDHDVDYLFGQVSIDKAFVDWSGNCGNLSAAVGPFAIANGLVHPSRLPENGLATVRIWQANIGKTIIAQVPMTDGAVQETGDFELDGVTFPAAEVQLEFLDPADEGDGEGGGAMFPTGNLVDDLEVPGVGTFQATLINAGIPTIFVNAEAIGYTGTELQDAINGDANALKMFETIRAYGAVRMGLIKDIAEAAQRQHTPKIAFVAGPADYVSSSGKPVAAADIDLLRARPVHGQAASRHDGHRRRRHRHRRRGSRHPGQPRRRRRRSHRRALRPSLRHPAGGRGSDPGEWPMDRDQGHHEPQRPGLDGRMGTGARRYLLTRLSKADFSPGIPPGFFQP
jgi:probable AcnD-accessory protein PrpF